MMMMMMMISDDGRIVGQINTEEQPLMFGPALAGKTYNIMQFLSTFYAVSFAVFSFKIS